jgi:hypothetical protein
MQIPDLHVVDFEKHGCGASLAEEMEPSLADMATFSDAARPHIFKALTQLWTKLVPMTLPPYRGDGLGFILLNSNADTHFSLTNALGMISTEQLRGIEIATAQYPQPCSSSLSTTSCRTSQMYFSCSHDRTSRSNPEAYPHRTLQV